MSGMCLRYSSVADTAPPSLPLVSAALSRSRCSLTSLSSAVSAALALSQQPLLSSLRQILLVYVRAFSPALDVTVVDHLVLFLPLCRVLVVA